MPYITSEEVKEKRQALKKAFPNIKFSVTKRGYCQINVTILSAPFNMLTEGKPYESVNQYHINENYKDHPKTLKTLLKIQEIISKNQRELVYDSDYGSVPTFYIDISIGSWDKPFKVKQ